MKNELLAVPLSGVKGLLTAVTGIIKLLIPAVFGLAIVYFFWGLGQFILHDAGNEKTRSEGKQKMLWGLIAIFIMASLYGIIHFIGGAFGIPVSTGGSGNVDNCAGNNEYSECP